MASEAPRCLRGQFREHHVDAYFRGNAVDRLVSGAIEVVLIDDRPTEHPLRPDHEVQRLAYGGLPDVVRADEQGVSLQEDRAFSDAPEMVQRHATYAHLPLRRQASPLGKSVSSTWSLLSAA